MGNIPQRAKAVAISTRKCLKSYWGLSLCESVTALPSSLMFGEQIYGNITNNTRYHTSTLTTQQYKCQE